MQCDHAQSAVVVLVHGTYAGSDADEGKGWWQRGSDASSRLLAMLPDDCRYPEGRLFHWSGKNDYLARYHAGQSLLTFLCELEEKQQPYHVIAHSHGGSVLWYALLLGALRKKFSKSQDETSPCPLGLPNLRSCATVGTPFLVFRSSRISRRRMLLTELVTWAISLSIPLLLTVALWPWLGYAALVGLTLLVATVPLGLALTLPWKFRHTQHYNDAVVSAVSRRWLSLCSREDEAVSLLRLSLGIEIPVTSIPRSIIPAEVIEEAPSLRWLLVGETLLNWLRGKLLNPLLNRIATKQIAALALGYPNRGDIQEVDFTPSEMLWIGPSFTDREEAALSLRADEALSQVSADLRPALQLAATARSLDPLASVARAGPELIHTSYFDHDFVLERIAMHVWQCHAPQ